MQLSRESVVASRDTALFSLRASYDLSRQQHLEQSRMSVLLAENDRLKRELNSFDPLFFDQLEDLKYRYNSLQEAVGQAPDPLQHIRQVTDYRPGDLSGISR